VVGCIKPVVSRDRIQSPITTYNYIGERELFFSRYVISLHYFYFFLPYLYRKVVVGGGCTVKWLNHAVLSTPPLDLGLCLHPPL
ncbi:hypothetical protein MK540_09160, partial [Streptococcus dysgalactiae]|uniref:hypothetical protein n=1 Tax=Streptococcus dysgalactiae TaxID=1334 RepID=UPI002284EAE3